MLKPGSKAPDFRAPSTHGSELSLADFAGQYLVLYFYPKDDTPGCSLEAQSFRDHQADFRQRQTSVVGVSADSIESHAKFSSKYQLPFPLLSDPSKAIIEAYDAWGEKSLYGKTTVGFLRTTVVIAPDGEVVTIFPKVQVKGHVEKVLEAIDAHRRA